jgi:hypothetical protein
MIVDTWDQPALIISDGIQFQKAISPHLYNKMSQIVSRPWYSVLVLALLAASAVHAQPIRQDAGEAAEIEARSPVSRQRNHHKDEAANKLQRLIPDTKEYVHEVFKGLGLADPSPTSTPSSTPTSTPTATMKAEQGQPEETKATQTTHITYESSTSYTPTYGSNGAGYTHTVKHQMSGKKPIENVQIGQGWDQGRQLTSEDLPLIFDAFYRGLKHRIGNMIDSSDEVGLDGFVNGL